MARIPTAANVAQAPSLRDPGVSVPAIGQEVAQAGYNIGSDLSNIAQRRRRVSEAVDRTMKESRAREYAFRAFNDWQSSGDMTDEESVGRFVREVESEFSSMLQDHSGDEESRARLQAQLEEIRLDTIFKASTASTMARREVLVSDLGRRQSETIGTVFQSATALDDVMADYDARLDDVSDALGDVATQRLRTQARSAFVKAAMDGAIARGDLGTVTTLLSDRSLYRQYLTPEASTVYRSQLAKAQSQRTKRQKLEAEFQTFREVFGREPTEEEKADIFGVTLSTSKPAELHPDVKSAVDAISLRDGVPYEQFTPEQRAEAFGRLEKAEAPDVSQAIKDYAFMLGKTPDQLTMAERAEAFGRLEKAEAPDVSQAIKDYAFKLGKTPDQLTMGERAEAFEAIAIQTGSTDYDVALRNWSDANGVPVSQIPQAIKQEIYQKVNSGDGLPYPGKSEFERLQNIIIPNLDAYAAGQLTLDQERTWESAVIRAASNRVMPSGEVVSGAMSSDAFRAIMQRGKKYDFNANAIINATEPPAPAAPPATGAALPPVGIRRPDLVTQERNPNLGVMNGAPPGAGAERPPAPPNPSNMTDAEVLAEAMRWADGDDTADLSSIARMDLFGRADDIAGPVAYVDRQLYAIPEIGPLLSGGDATAAAANIESIVRVLSRVQQQSPRFASGELLQIIDETRDLIGAKFWDNTQRYRTGVVAIDNFLAGVEESSRVKMKDRNLTREERNRATTMLQDLDFVRTALGVKKLPHPKTRAEVEALPPGTVFIFNGQHYTRSAGSTN